MADNDERTSVLRGLAGATLLAIGLVAFVVVMTYIGTHDTGEPERERDVRGTSGRLAYVPEGEHTNAVPASPTDAAVIDELETITDAVDRRELLGRPVDLLLDLGGATGNANASGRFWIGPAETPVLVVLLRERSDEPRLAGEPPDNRVFIPSVPNGGPVTMRGRVQRLPTREAMLNWRLTRHEQQILANRPLYISAESARPAS